MHGDRARIAGAVSVWLMAAILASTVAAAPAGPGVRPLPLAMRYVGQATASGNLELVMALRGASTVAISVVGPHLSGIFSTQTTVTAAGAVTFSITGKDDATPVTYSFAGTRTGNGFAGKWTSTNGRKGKWSADRVADVGNTGTWTLMSPFAGLSFSWTAAFGVLARISGVDYLAVFFDGPSTSYPVDAALILADLSTVTIGPAAPIRDLLLRPNADPAVQFCAKEGASNTVTFSQFAAVMGSLLSGSITCTESQFGGTAQLQLTDQAFANIRIVRDYR